MRAGIIPGVATAILLAAGAIMAAEPAPVAADDPPLVDEAIRQFLQDRNYVEAIGAIDTALQVKGAAVDYLSWLKGRALFLQGQYDSAIATFEGIEQQYPKSPWVRRARFSKAIALARKGDFRAAEVIYRDEAAYLLSENRKQEIADIYLEFAQAYFKPPKEDQKPDNAKALEFAKKALEVGPKSDRRAEVELLVARCLQRLGKLDEAAALYEKFIQEHAADQLDVEARYNLGETRLTQGNAKQARRAWQDLLAKHTDVASDRVAEAAFRLSRTWGVPPLDEGSTQTAAVQNRQTAAPRVSTDDLNLGIAALEAFVERFPNHKLASRAHVDIATSYIAYGRHEDAVRSLKRFLADPRYQDREEVPAARNLLGRSYQLQEKYDEALAVWREYLVKHPAHSAWIAVQQEIVNTEYLIVRGKMQARVRYRGQAFSGVPRPLSAGPAQSGGALSLGADRL